MNMILWVFALFAGNAGAAVEVGCYAHSPLMVIVDESEVSFYARGSVDAEEFVIGFADQMDFLAPGDRRWDADIRLFLDFIGEHHIYSLSKGDKFSVLAGSKIVIRSKGSEFVLRELTEVFFQWFLAVIRESLALSEEIIADCKT